MVMSDNFTFNQFNDKMRSSVKISIFIVLAKKLYHGWIYLYTLYIYM